MCKNSTILSRLFYLPLHVLPAHNLPVICLLSACYPYSPLCVQLRIKENINAYYTPPSRLAAVMGSVRVYQNNTTFRIDSLCALRRS